MKKRPENLSFLETWISEEDNRFLLKGRKKILEKKLFPPPWFMNLILFGFMIFLLCRPFFKVGNIFPPFLCGGKENFTSVLGLFFPSLKNEIWLWCRWSCGVFFRGRLLEWLGGMVLLRGEEPFPTFCIGDYFSKGCRSETVAEKRI